MDRLLLFLAGLILFCLLSFFCVQHHLDAIETDLTERTRAALQLKGYDWVDSDLDGRKVNLSGTAPSQKLLDHAEQVVSDVRGVASVENQIIVAETLPDIPVTEPVIDYNTTFTVSEETVTLKGMVPNQEIKANLLAIAAQQFRAENIYDQLIEAKGASIGWAKAAESALTQLQVFNEGKVQIINTKIHLTGTSSNKTAMTHLESNLSQELPDDFQASFDIKVVKPVTKQQTPEPLALDCNKRLSDLLAGQSIHFRPDSHSIHTNEQVFLGKLIDAALDCPGSHIEVGAYADSRGSEGYNNRLSQRRADAVVRYLVSRGIAEERLVAIGYGELNPIANNINMQGRAKNRRIEFKVVRN